MDNIIKVSFGATNKCRTRPLYVLDYGIYLQINDDRIDDSTVYAVHFAKQKSGSYYSVIKTEQGVKIPEALLQSNGTIYAWLYYHTGESDGETLFEIEIPIIPRPDTPAVIPTPHDHDLIEDAIAALNAGVEEAREYAAAADASAIDAAGSADDAAASATTAGNAATAAESSASTAYSHAQDANGYAVAAGNAKTAAETAQGKAETAQGKAESAKTAAEAAAGQTALDVVAAGQSADAAAGSAGEARGYANDASGYATLAQGFSNNASGFADNASGYATNAYNSATAASGSAGEASGYATTASGYATDANNAKIAAQGAQTAAETAQGLAEAAQTGAESAQTAAETARDAAIAATEDKAPVILDSASGAIVSIVDGAQGMNARSLVASMSPIQDLHGYSNPWPAGGGKNLLNNTATTTTSNDVTFTVNADGTVSTSGTATGTAVLRIFQTFSINADLALNGCPAGGSYDSKYSIIAAKSNGTIVQQSAMDTGNGGTIDAANVSSIAQIQIIIRTGTNADGLVFKPMLRLASDTDATYAPYSNICPISGRTGVTVTRTGKNLLPQKFYNGITYNAAVGTTLTLTELSDVTANGYTFSRDVSGWNGFGMCSPKLPTDTYYLKATLASPSMRSSIYVLNNDMSVSRNIGNHASGTSRNISSAITLSGREAYICFNCITSSAGTVSITAPQLELSSTESDYSAYTGTSYPVTWQTEAGTVYGGTVDIVSGVLTVTHGSVTFDGSQTNLAFAAGTTANRISWNGYTSIGKAGTPFLSDTLKTSPNATSIKGDPWLIYNASKDSRMFMTVPTTMTSVNDFNTYCTSHPINVVYTLATPQTYQLTPTQVQMLLGANNVWATGDSVSLTYPCDTKLYMERLTAPTEDDMTANANIASGKYFMVGNRLFRSIASIPNGTEIIIGTNCVPLSLADALNALNE